jgi:hypothetical protein
MAYPDYIKIRAYALFIQGNTYEETARLLAKEFKVKITPNTIKNWAEKKDSHGGSWIDYRNDTRAVAMQTVEVAETSRIVKIRDKAETLTEKIYDQLTGDAAPKISSMDGGSYAFKSLSEFLLKLDQKTQENMSVVSIIQMVLEIFAEVPEVRKIIQKHWASIEKEIRIRILHQDPEDVNPRKSIGNSNA